MNQARLAFRMNADIAGLASMPEPSTDPLPPGWVRIPVSFAVTLPEAVLTQASRGNDAS